MATQLDIANLPKLPASATNCLLAGWIGNFALVGSGGDPGVNFLINTNGFGIAANVNFSGTVAQWSISGVNNDVSVIFASNANIAMDISVGWTSFAFSIDSSSQLVQILINRTLYVPSGGNNNWIGSGNMDFNPTTDPWRLSIFNSDGTGNVDLSDLRFHAGEGFFDLSVTTNQNKLFDVNNNPVNWGSDGSVVTGIVPAVYLHGNASTYANNLGSGGAFTLSGTTPTTAIGPD